MGSLCGGVPDFLAAPVLLARARRVEAAAATGTVLTETRATSVTASDFAAPTILGAGETRIEYAPEKLTYTLHAYVASFTREARSGGTSFVFIADGVSQLRVRGLSGTPPSARDAFTATLLPGMYARIPGSASFSLSDGEGIVIDVHNQDHGVFMLGGPVSSLGDFRYIDGCTDSLLLAPSRKGLSCLNHLHFPPHTTQTLHWHPSDRIGMVTQGVCECRKGPLLSRDPRTGLVVQCQETDTTRITLLPGDVFILPAHTWHAFETTTESLDVIAWHPDSDFGPSDEDHPMINRTLGATGAKMAPQL